MTPLEKINGELGEIQLALSLVQPPRGKPRMGTVEETEMALPAVGHQVLF